MLRLPFFPVPSIGAWDPPALFALYCAGLLPGLAGLRGRIADAPRAFAIVHRAVIGVFVLYAAGATVPAGEDGTSLQIRLRWLEAARVVAVASGVVAWWRPSFGLALLLYVAWFRAEADALHGLRIVLWDHTPVLVFGLVLVLGFVLAELATPARRTVAPDAADERRRGLIGSVLLCGVGYYLASYFRSGLGKVTLNGGPSSWLLANQTDALMLVARQVGMLPIAGLETLAARTYEGVALLRPGVNAVVLAAELAAAAAILRASWTAAAALTYAVLHLAIYLLSGVFFWKWLVVDLALARAFHGLRSAPGAPRALRVAAFVLALVVHRVLPVATLAWYDTRALNDAYFVAVADDGREYRVPSNYFLTASTTMAQMGFAFDLFDSRLPTGILGGTPDYATMRAANTCSLPVQAVGSGRDAATWSRLERFVRWHHRYVLSRVNAEGRLAYDLYPHHLWSDPFTHGAFARLDKRRIRAYRFVLDLVCVGFEDGAPTLRTLSHQARDIPVGP